MLKLLLLSLYLLETGARPDRGLHPQPLGIKTDGENPENLAEFWYKNAQTTLNDHLYRIDSSNEAKHVILFMGDGMSVPTLAATRAYLGNENEQLSFEKFMFTGISKTYCVDSQVADSACSATAFLGGVKANIGTIGVTGQVQYGDCQAMANKTYHVQSIAQWAQAKGKSTGFVTTARVTDASPAGIYGHTANRGWETDTNILDAGEDPSICTDLATQLITSDVGQKLNVIMGGGRNAFLPIDAVDDEGNNGTRSDSVNLIDLWLEGKQGQQAFYVWNRDQLLALNDTTDYILGLFESDQCKYNFERDESLDPSLSEMVSVAIQTLSKNSNGFFLFVEGALIDVAHHENKAHLALDETVEFSKAIELAGTLTSTDDTLMVVTSDHAHTMTISGYPKRGNSIFGIAGQADDGLPFTTLNYANGPGFKIANVDGTRHNVSGDDLNVTDYQYPGGFYTSSETHGGDDVLIFAQGPWSRLFTGVMEQNVIPHLMGYASCIGNNTYACDLPSAGSDIYLSMAGFAILLLFSFSM